MSTKPTSMLTAKSMIIVTRIEAELVRGTPRAEIISIISEQYNIKARQICSFIARARQAIGQSADEDRELFLAIARARLNNWVNKAIEKEDYRTAVIAQRELNAINGLHEPKAVTVNIFANHPVDLSIYRTEQPDELTVDQGAGVQGDFDYRVNK
jgi:hypothetical protein